MLFELTAKEAETLTEENLEFMGMYHVGKSFTDDFTYTGPNADRMYRVLNLRSFLSWDAQKSGSTGLSKHQAGRTSMTHLTASSTYHCAKCPATISSFAHTRAAVLTGGLDSITTTNRATTALKGLGVTVTGTRRIITTSQRGKKKKKAKVEEWTTTDGDVLRKYPPDVGCITLSGTIDPIWGVWEALSATSCTPSRISARLIVTASKLSSPHALHVLSLHQAAILSL